MKVIDPRQCFLVLVLSLFCTVLMALEETAAPKAKNDFYPQFCFGFGASDPQYDTPAEQAKLLSTLGYDGYSHYKVDGLVAVLQAVDENHLKLFQFYVDVSLDPAKPKYDERLKEALALLQGRETIVSLLFLGGKTLSPSERESKTIAVLREIADMAKTFGLRVALYPYYETMQNTIDIVQKADRKNLGVIFSEVFFFISEEKKDLVVTLKTAMPYIYAVNINGVDGDYKGNDLTRLIQTLDRGSFDNLALLKTLNELGYTGPVGLHCCYVKGNVQDNLARSMKAWKQLNSRLKSD